MSFRTLCMLTLLPISIGTLFACDNDKTETEEARNPATHPNQDHMNGMANMPAAHPGAMATNGAPSDDPAMGARVKDALFRDPATTSKQITVQVVDGEVTLSGFVDSWAEKMAAGRVARSINNMGGVNNNLSIGHTDDEMGDGPVALRVKAALINSPTTMGRDINVEALQGVVQLSGYVGSIDEKSNATEVATSVNGVKSVQNKLEVKTL